MLALIGWWLCIYTTFDETLYVHIHWTTFLIGHLYFILLFNNKVEQFQRQYTNIKYGKQVIGAKELYIQNFNVITFILFAKIKYKVWPVCRDDLLEILFSVYLPKMVSGYDQEIPQSQTADKPMAPRWRATQQSWDTRKANKAKQPALSSPSRWLQN